MIIDGIAYQPVAATGEAMRIVIADNRGLTFVGRCSLEGDGEWITIRDARCIIRWGTSGHLAQLVAGPQANTKLGAAADVRIRRANIIAVYECGAGWLA